jgi:hypothetical protein
MRRNVFVFEAEECLVVSRGHVLVVTKPRGVWLLSNLRQTVRNESPSFFQVLFGVFEDDWSGF